MGSPDGYLSLQFCIAWSCAWLAALAGAGVASGRGTTRAVSAVLLAVALLGTLLGLSTIDRLGTCLEHVSLETSDFCTP